MRGLRILDVDNVLSDDEWRIPLIKWERSCPTERYHDYHLASAFDHAKNHRLLSEHSDRNILFTAMPERYRALRVLWFNVSRIGYGQLFMRADDDHRPSDLVKRDMLFSLFKQGVTHADIELACDDRTDVLDMYMLHGISNVQVVRIHDSCAYTKPGGTKDGK